MRLPIIIGMIALLVGCAGPQTDPASPVATATRIEPLVEQSGRIVSVNAGLQFVVIEFPGGILPEIGQQLTVHRDETVVGSVKISGPHRNLHTIADIRNGEIQTGDEVRPSGQR